MLKDKIITGVRRCPRRITMLPEGAQAKVLYVNHIRGFFLSNPGPECLIGALPLLVRAPEGAQGARFLSRPSLLARGSAVISLRLIPPAPWARRRGSARCFRAVALRSSFRGSKTGFGACATVFLCLPVQYLHS